MAVAVVKPSVASVEVLFPGDRNQIWYRVDRPNVYETHLGGSTAQVSVDIATVSLSCFKFWLFRVWLLPVF